MPVFLEFTGYSRLHRMSVKMIECQLFRKLRGIEEADTAQESASSQDGEAQDNIVTTSHTAVIQGKELSYTAQAGTMVLETGDMKRNIHQEGC